jgi:hypothetical protein
MSLSPELAERLGLLIAALGNGLALEKLLDPEGIPDGSYGDLLTLIFGAFRELARTSTRPTRRTHA